MTIDTEAVDPRTTSVSSFRRMTATGRDYLVVWCLLAIAAFLSLTTSTFATPSNLLNLADSAATLGLIACGVTVVMMAGAFDLSVGSIFALSGVAAAQATTGLPGPAALTAGVAAGGVCGLINGGLVSYVRVHAILATLATTVVFGGVAVVISGGYSVRAQDPEFSVVGTGRVFGLTWATVTLLLFALICTLLLRYTSFGRRVYATGSNSRVAEYAGIHAPTVTFLAYGISGTAAGLAGVLAASSLGQGQPGTGSGLELLAIAAVAIGGSSVLGGEGAIWRTLVGVLLLRTLNNGFNLLGVESPYRDIVTGAVIVIAVGLDVRSRLKNGTLRR